MGIAKADDLKNKPASSQKTSAQNEELSLAAAPSDDSLKDNSTATPPNKELNQGYVRALLGGVFITSAGGGTIPTVGIDVGMNLTKDYKNQISLGFFTITGGRTISALGVGIKSTATVIGEEFLCSHINGTPLYVGMRAGVDIQSFSATVNGTDLQATGTSLAIMPLIGVDIPVDKIFSLGVEISYARLGAGTANGSLTLPYEAVYAFGTLVFGKLSF